MKSTRTVYAIQHNQTGRIYVGSTSNLMRRISTHFYWLRSGKHPNKQMQKDYDLYGEDYSVFTLESSVPFEERFLEYEWMDRLKTGDERYGYNSRDAHYRNRKKESSTFDFVEFIDGVPIPNWMQR